MSIRWISIELEPSRVESIPGLVLRTAPKVGPASDGKRYYFKGDRPEIVVSESIAYCLAEAVGLRVPPWALCRMPPNNQIYFASQAVSFNSGIDALIEAGETVNPELLEECIAFDIWTANIDRNMGGIVADAAATRQGMVELFAIDFEQAAVLNGTDFLTVGGIASRECLPKELLSRYCRGRPFPDAMVRAITAMSADQVEDVLGDLESDIEFPRVKWLTSTKRQLVGRAARIETLVREAWYA